MRSSLVRRKDTYKLWPLAAGQPQKPARYQEQVVFSFGWLILSMGLLGSLSLWGFHGFTCKYLEFQTSGVLWCVRKVMPWVFVQYPHVPGMELGLACEGRRRWTFNQSYADGDGFPSAGLCFPPQKALWRVAWRLIVLGGVPSASAVIKAPFMGAAEVESAAITKLIAWDCYWQANWAILLWLIRPDVQDIFNKLQNNWDDLITNLERMD